MTAPSPEKRGFSDISISNIVPDRVSGPVGYVPREHPAIAEHMPANAHAARIVSIAKAVKAAKSQRPKPRAKPPESAVIETCQSPMPAIEPAAINQPSIADPGPRALNQATVLAVLPDNEPLAFSRSQWADALGLSHPAEIVRLSSMIERLKRRGTIMTRPGPGGYLLYWRTPAGELRESGIKRKGLTLKILNALPADESYAVGRADLAEQFGVRPGGRKVLSNVLERLRTAGEIASKPHPEIGGINLYWRIVPPVDLGDARPEPRTAPDPEPVRQTVRQPDAPVPAASSRTTALLAERARICRRLADALDTLGLRLAEFEPADARALLIAALDALGEGGA